MAAAIKIIAGDPHFDVAAWAKEKADAATMADALYAQAVLLGQDAYKVAFFDAHRREKEIGQAIDRYFAA